MSCKLIAELSVAVFLMIFGAHMYVSFIIKVKILEVIK